MIEQAQNIDNMPRLSVRGHIPVLDSVRGMAILMVLVHNVGMFDVTPDSLAMKLVRLVAGAGWVGVQLFFVLSGFLITGILIDMRRGPNYFRSFYIRRVLRIFPLYYLTLIAAFLVLPHLIDLGAWADHARQVQIWYWTYLLNYSDPFLGTITGLSHFWSLAVEEQYYLVWPFVVYFLSQRRLLFTCCVIIIAALLIRIFMVAYHAPVAAIYNFSITRCDALACGSGIAVIVRNRAWHERLTRWLRYTGLASGIVILAIMAKERGLSWTSPLSQTIGYLSLTLFFGSLILFALKITTAPGRLRNYAEAGWLRFFGKYSYGIYVLHLPISMLAHSLFTAWVIEGSSSARFWHLIIYIAGNLIVSTLAAVIVWHLIEQRFLALKDIWARKELVA